MVQKDLLIVYNTFGKPRLDTQYIDNLKSIFWHIEKHNLYENTRVVVSSVLNDQKYIDELIQHFGDKITVIKYDYRWSLQVTFNKTIQTTIDNFKEEYNGYLYVSAGINFPEIDDLFPRMIEKNNSGEYGMIHLDVDHDHGHENLNENPSHQATLDLSKDYVIPIKQFCHFVVVLINKSVKDFYGVAVSDVYGKCGMEASLSFTCAAIRKKYILMGNSKCYHIYHADSQPTDEFLNGGDYFEINCGLLWGRTHDTFRNDIEGIDSGLGHYPGPYIKEAIWKYYNLPPKIEKFDENYLSIDERLKHSVKRCYFTNKNEVDYDKIINKIL
jgi:hypothetical protein